MYIDCLKYTVSSQTVMSCYSQMNFTVSLVKIHGQTHGQKRGKNNIFILFLEIKPIHHDRR